MRGRRALGQVSDKRFAQDLSTEVISDHAWENLFRSNTKMPAELLREEHQLLRFKKWILLHI